MISNELNHPAMCICKELRDTSWALTPQNATSAESSDNEDGGVAQPFGFALTDGYGRLSAYGSRWELRNSLTPGKDYWSTARGGGRAEAESQRRLNSSESIAPQAGLETLPSSPSPSLARPLHAELALLQTEPSLFASVPAHRPAFLAGMRRTRDPLRRRPQHRSDHTPPQHFLRLIYGAPRLLNQLDRGQQGLTLLSKKLLSPCVFLFLIMWCGSSMTILLLEKVFPPILFESGRKTAVLLPTESETPSRRR